MRFLLFCHMKKLMLQPRLQLLANMIPPGSRLADVGTDHGYLPVYLLQNGRITGAIASDIGAEPLQHARQTAAEYAVEGIEFRLCPGLDAIAPEEVDAVVIAGMGGETIQSVLAAAPWTAQGRHFLLLQPMTKVELLRRWLTDNHYYFTDERLVWDKEHLYPVFAVRGGTQAPLTAVQQYGGVLLDGDPLYDAYLEERIGKLERAVEGLRRSAAAENLERAAQLAEVLDALREKRGKR